MGNLKSKGGGGLMHKHGRTPPPAPSEGTKEEKTTMDPISQEEALKMAVAARKAQADLLWSQQQNRYMQGLSNSYMHQMSGMLNAQLVTEAPKGLRPEHNPALPWWVKALAWAETNIFGGKLEERTTEGSNEVSVGEDDPAEDGGDDPAKGGDLRL